MVFKNHSNEICSNEIRIRRELPVIFTDCRETPMITDFKPQQREIEKVSMKHTWEAENEEAKSLYYSSIEVKQY